MPVFTGGPDPAHTWMAFVDGENLAIQGKKVAADNGITLIEGENYRKDVYVWLPKTKATTRIGHAAAPTPIFRFATRAYYYTSLVGSDEDITSVRRSLRELGFDPQVFKRKASQRKSKGVDIALTKDMLSHAFLDHYEVAVLIAGDGDYVPLVEQVKRLGKPVFVWFFENYGLQDELKLASDWFCDLTPLYVEDWKWATGSP